MKIIDKLSCESPASHEHCAHLSFEYFPLKTSIGVENLKLRIDSMASAWNPLFVDVTMGTHEQSREVKYNCSPTVILFIGAWVCVVCAADALGFFRVIFVYTPISWCGRIVASDMHWHD